MDTVGSHVSKNFYETVCFQLKRKKWADRKCNRGETKWSCSWLKHHTSAASSSGRNEWPWTHCSLILKEKKKLESICQMCQRTWDRRKDGGEKCVAERKIEKRSGKLDGAVETSGELAKWRRLQQRPLSTLGQPNTKEESYHPSLKVSN